MRLSHFEAFAPVCPACAARGRPGRALVLATICSQSDEVVQAGLLHCPDPTCRHEFPIIDGIPVIVPDLARLMAERGVELLLREDLDPVLESLVGDAIGPDSWFDTLRQTLSTYGWDGYGDLDLSDAEPGAAPGAVRRCLSRLLAMAGDGVQGNVVDLGCGAGRSSFDLAAAVPQAPVLGLDVNLALLHLAAGVGRGHLSYPRRRIGLVYDRRSFPVALPGAAQVDFWAADALALPLAPASAGLVVALNLLDCVPDPLGLLGAMAALLRPGGRMLLATPFDWATRATPVQSWIGGHSQRSMHEGSAEPFLRDLLTGRGHDRAITGLALLAEEPDWPWQTRLHARSTVHYRAYLAALAKNEDYSAPIPGAK